MTIRPIHPLALGLVAALLLLAGGAAVADAASPTTTTIVSDGSQAPYTPDYACLPPSGSLSYTYHDVMHVTDFGNGVFHYGEEQNGSALFITSSGDEYSGRFTIHQSINSNSAPGQYAFTFPIRFDLVSGSGARLSFTVTEHGAGTPSGRTFSFDVSHC